MEKLAAIWVLMALAAPAFPDSADEIRCREIGFSKSVETQDRDAFASFVDPDARFIGGQVTRGREAIAEAWSVFFTGDLPTIKWRPEFIEVLESGDLALSRGPYRMLDKDEHGGITESWGTFNSVWRRKADNEWLVVFDAGSSADEAPGEAQRSALESDADCD